MSYEGIRLSAECFTMLLFFLISQTVKSISLPGEKKKAGGEGAGQSQWDQLSDSHKLSGISLVVEDQNALDRKPMTIQRHIHKPATTS